MPRNLKSDLSRLATLAFRASAHRAPLLKKFHALRCEIDHSGHADLIWNIYDWLLVPLSLWPLDFAGLSHHVVRLLKSSSSSNSFSDLCLCLSGV